MTFARRPAADFVAITIEPAARVGDPVTGRLVLERRYHVVLRSLVNDKVRRSRQTFNDREVVGIAQRFLGRSTEQAFAALEALDTTT